MIRHANGLNGTTCAFLFFDRSAGSVQTRASASISAHVISATSLRLQPVSSITRMAAPKMVSCSQAAHRAAISPSFK